MSDSPKEPCALCGLDIEQETVLRTGGTVLKFCCEGCLGIYELVNDVEPEEEQGRRKSPLG